MFEKLNILFSSFFERLPRFIQSFSEKIFEWNGLDFQVMMQAPIAIFRL